jgi:hypothetical protein
MRGNRYPRRDFLGHCVAAPLAAQAVLNGARVVADEPPAIVTARTAAHAAVDLEKEVESLLKLVDPQVVYRRVPVAPEKNAWPLWKKAYERYVKQPEDEEFQSMMDAVLDTGVIPKGHLKRRLLEWIDNNKECRNLTDEGIQLGEMELPRSLVAPRLSMAMDEIDMLRQFAQIRAINSYVALDKGDFNAACHECFMCLGFGQILLDSEAMLVDFLVGLAVLWIGVAATYRFATADGVPQLLALDSIERLARCRVDMGVLKRAYRVEYCRWTLPYIAAFLDKGTTKELIEHYLFGQFEAGPDYQPSDRAIAERDRAIRDISFLLDGHRKPLDKEATTRLGSELHLRLFKELDKDVRSREDDFQKELRTEISAWPDAVEPDWWLIASNDDSGTTLKRLTRTELFDARNELRSVINPLGKRIVSQLVSALDIRVIERGHTRLDSARLRIALRFYERKHGRLPERLAVLVDAGFLPDVPRDPFDGKQFKYSPERRVIWSVGTDGMNDGYTPETEDPENPAIDVFDMTWRI